MMKPFSIWGVVVCGAGSSVGCMVGCIVGLSSSSNLATLTSSLTSSLGFVVSSKCSLSLGLLFRSKGRLRLIVRIIEGSIEGVRWLVLMLIDT